MNIAISVSALEAQQAAATNAPDYKFSTSAAEAVKRKWQEQQLEEYNMQIDVAAMLSRQPNGHRSQSTITQSDSFPQEVNCHYDFPSRTTRCRAIGFFIGSRIVLTYHPHKVTWETSLPDLIEMIMKMDRNPLHPIAIKASTSHHKTLSLTSLDGSHPHLTLIMCPRDLWILNL